MLRLLALTVCFLCAISTAIPVVEPANPIYNKNSAVQQSILFSLVITEWHGSVTSFVSEENIVQLLVRLHTSLSALEFT